MKIKRLKVEQLRNIRSLEIEPEARHNIITGNNGAGKTTLLEAIYLLARAKSFRTNQRRSPIQNGADQLTLFAELLDHTNNSHKLGLSKSPSQLNVRLDGLPVNKLSELANTLPVSLITPNSHKLIEEGPDQRRRLLNWGVFHVEHEFKYLAARLNRTLLQRNNALRKGSKDLSVWDKSFVEASELVNQTQKEYFSLWLEQLTKLKESISFLKSLEVRLIYGWPVGSDLYSSIAEKEASDRERGFTSVGPHRADIEFKIDGIATKNILSRGQQKVLVTCILKAQMSVLESQTGKRAVTLYDDLDSELDSNSLEHVSNLLSDQYGQTFITTINPEKLSSLRNKAESGMFHVEHGRLS